MFSTLRGFAHQAKQALVGAPNDAQSWKKEAGPDLLHKPVVLDSNDGQLNSDILGLLLHTIFAQHPALIDVVGSRLALVAGLATISGAESAIEKIVMEALANDEKDACVMAADFYAHKTRSHENARAYSPAQRKNPNAVFWPNPKHPELPRSIYDELPFVEPSPFITRSTKIVSMGSCFAIEIAYMLQKEGYNYVVTEPNACPKGSYYYTYYETAEYSQSSAA